MAESVEQIARRLVETREALGYSGRNGQSRFCDAIKVQKNIYNPFEKAKRRISLDVALKIHAEFGVPLDWIYCGEREFLSEALRRKLRQVA